MIVKNKPISKVEIEKRCSEIKEGKTVLDNLCIKQLVNRIKYERRKNEKVGLRTKHVQLFKILNSMQLETNHILKLKNCSH